jgi:hypothetical protein
MVNISLILLIFSGLCYWMTVQKRLNGLSNVPAEIKDAKGWYKEGSNKSKLK